MIYQFKAEEVVPNLHFDINLEKDKRVYCFIGENAIGKTKLLEAMGKSLIYCHSLFRPQKENLPYSGLHTNNKINSEISNLELKLPLSISINDTDVKDAKKDRWAFTKLKIIPDQKLPFIFYKPLVFIGTKDRGYTKNIDTDKHIEILGDKYDRFIKAFLRSFDYMNGEKIKETETASWIASRLLINPDFVTSNENRQNEVIALLELMDKLEPSLNLVKKDENGNTRLKMYFSDGKLYLNDIPLDVLSTGYVSIIKIFQEIIAAYGGWTDVEFFPKIIADYDGWTNTTYLQNVEGVVFIDEIESHLHAEWQAKIIPILKEFFPNTTFYIATHSPLIVSTTEEGEAYNLVKKGDYVVAEKLGNPREWYLADVYAQAFNVDILKLKKELAKDNEPTLNDLLKEFSVKVKNYQKSKNGKAREDIEKLYKKILPSLGNDDPRRRSLDSLWSLVK